MSGRLWATNLLGRNLAVPVGAHRAQRSESSTYGKYGRSRAAIDQVASQFVHKRPVTCSECREGFIKRWSRIVLEAGTWSGEDLFLPRGLTGTIMASERFREFFERHAINNGVLIKAEEYAHDYYPWESTSGTEPKS